MIISFLKSTEKQSNKFVDCRFELKSNGWFVFKNKTMANKGTFGKVLTKSLGIQKRVHSTFVTDTQAVSSLWVSSQWILWLLTYHVLLWCVYLTLRKRFLPFVNINIPAYIYILVAICLKFSYRLTLTVREIWYWMWSIEGEGVLEKRIPHLQLTKCRDHRDTTYYQFDKNQCKNTIIYFVI